MLCIDTDGLDGGGGVVGIVIETVVGIVRDCVGSGVGIVGLVGSFGGIVFGIVVGIVAWSAAGIVVGIVVNDAGIVDGNVVGIVVL